MKFKPSGKLHTLKVTIKPLEWHFWPNWVGGNTPNVREIFFLCFRINIYFAPKYTPLTDEELGV